MQIGRFCSRRAIGSIAFKTTVQCRFDIVGGKLKVSFKTIAIEITCSWILISQAECLDSDQVDSWRGLSTMFPTRRYHS